MSNSDIKTLIKRYKKENKICNCELAYSDRDGSCKYGCSSNQLTAREYVAGEVIKELTKQSEK